MAINFARSTVIISVGAALSLITVFDWGAHRIIVNRAPWGGTWVNRGA